LTNYPTDEEMIADWNSGQQRAQQLAWQLHIRPDFLMGMTAQSPPSTLRAADQWYAEPWLEEQEALAKMGDAEPAEVDDTPAAPTSGAAALPAASTSMPNQKRKRCGNSSHSICVYIR
jgi:hypothetical protein